MKRILLLLLLTFSINSFGQGFKTFKIDNNKITEANLSNDATTLNKIAEELGYESPKYFTYDNYDFNKDIITVLLKSFTAEPFAIITSEEVTNLPNSIVNEYFKDFSKERNYSSYTIEGQLNDGILSRNLTSKYFSQLFNTPIEENGSYLDMINNYLLTFENGILVKYSATDGLEKWSRSFKTNSPEMFEKLKFEATKFFKGNQTDILYFINSQCTSFANIPHAYKNEYLREFEHPNGYINFTLLLFSKYTNTSNLSFDQFEKITLGEAKKTSENRYTYLNHTYTFNQQNELEKITSINQ